MHFHVSNGLSTFNSYIKCLHMNLMYKTVTIWKIWVLNDIFPIWLVKQKEKGITVNLSYIQMLKGSPSRVGFWDSNFKRHFQIETKMEKICVAVRVRPPAPENGASLWKVEDNRISLHKSLDTPITTASHAFGKFIYFLINQFLEFQFLQIWLKS